MFRSECFARAARIGLVLGIAFATSGHAVAQGRPAPNDPIVLLLKGFYQPATNAPDLKLPGVNLNDGTWIVTEIHPVTSIPGSTNQNSAVVGHFYAQTTSALVAYDLPGGAIEMEFTAGSFNENPPVPDGGSLFARNLGTDCRHATGIYSPYKGGHNQMVDRLDACRMDQPTRTVIASSASVAVRRSGGPRINIDREATEYGQVRRAA